MQIKSLIKKLSMHGSDHIILYHIISYHVARRRRYWLLCNLLKLVDEQINIAGIAW